VVSWGRGRGVKNGWGIMLTHAHTLSAGIQAASATGTVAVEKLRKLVYSQWLVGTTTVHHTLEIHALANHLRVFVNS